MSLRDQMKEDQKKYGTENKDFFRFEETGNYRLRVLTNPIPNVLATHFFGTGMPSHVCYGTDKGCPFHGEFAPKDKDGNIKQASIKYQAYVIDRRDNLVKLAELPYSVCIRLADFEEDEDFKFDGFPMPMDIKIKVDKETKSPKEMYKTECSPKLEPLTEAENKAFEEAIKRMTPEDYVEKRKQKQLDKHMESGIWQKEQDRQKTISEKIHDAIDAHKQIGQDYPEENISSEDIPF